MDTEQIDYLLDRLERAFVVVEEGENCNDANFMLSKLKSFLYTLSILNASNLDPTQYRRYEKIQSSYESHIRGWWSGI